MEYGVEYIKRLEALYHEQIRQTINMEIHYSASVQENEKLKEQYELSQKEVEKQNELIAQATKSIETLTANKTSLEEKLHTFIEVIDENKNNKIKLRDLEKECERKQEELQKTYDELVDVKKQYELDIKELKEKIESLEGLLDNNSSKKRTKAKKEVIKEDYNTF